ncbi:MAG: hypothetical protein QOJ60_99 [Actinomycetota bacterium]|jgi:hypothetical protein|nr:hypothetical protein [Actinomycetota bacterium]
MATYRADMKSANAIRLRLTWSQRRAFVLTVIGYQVLVWADTLLDAGRLGGNPRASLAGLALGVMAAATWWIGTSATRRGIVVHALPPLVIPWDEVHEIEVQRQFGVLSVVVHHGVGRKRKTRLSAPTTGRFGRDGDFQDKVHALRAAWAAHRVTDAAA